MPVYRVGIYSTYNTKQTYFSFLELTVLHYTQIFVFFLYKTYLYFNEHIFVLRLWRKQDRKINLDSYQILQASDTFRCTLNITLFCHYSETAYDNLSHTV